MAKILRFPRRRRRRPGAWPPDPLVLGEDRAGRAHGEAFVGVRRRPTDPSPPPPAPPVPWWRRLFGRR